MENRVFIKKDSSNVRLKISMNSLVTLHGSLRDNIDLMSDSYSCATRKNGQSWDDVFIERIGESELYLEDLMGMLSEFIDKKSKNGELDDKAIHEIDLSKKDFVILVKSLENLLKIMSNDQDKKDDRWWESEFHSRIGASRASAHELLNQLNIVF